MNTALGVIIGALILLPFSGSLMELVRLASSDDRYTYTLLAPFGVGALVWLHFRGISSSLRPSLPVGGALVGAAWLLWIAGLLGPASPLSLRILLLVCLSWGAAFALLGLRAGREILFPMAVLAIFIPLPLSWMNSIVEVLQTGSADTAFGLFKMLGVPVHRESLFVFSLPGLEMEVAEECSGIRSTTSLFVSSIVAVYLTLDRTWQRFFVILLVVPISILKNAMRIVTLSYLGIYVDRGFLYGELHRNGGIPFSMLAMILLGSVILWLRRRGRVTEAAEV